MEETKKNKEMVKFKSVIVKILKKNGIVKAGLFGSYARGEQKKNSDIDLLVKVKKGTGLFNFAGIKLELEEKLGKNVDLLTYSSVHPYLKEEIFKEEVRII